MSRIIATEQVCKVVVALAPLAIMLGEQENTVQFTLGLGVEYATRFGLALRAETLVFDADANHTQLALLYRFGRRPKSSPEYVAPMVFDRNSSAQADTEETLAATIHEPAPSSTRVVPGNTIVNSAIAGTRSGNDGDRDNDGVKDELDVCDESLPGSLVDDSGCVLYTGVLEGVTFVTGSSELTPEAQNILVGVAEILKGQPSTRIELSAYTDNVGTEQQNIALSIERVKSVALHLIGAGVNKTQLELKAYGVTRPIASNNTEEGRRTNRRVGIRRIE